MYTLLKLYFDALIICLLLPNLIALHIQLMDFTLNVYGLVLLFFGSLASLLSFHIYKRGSEVINWFVCMMIGSAIWCIAYGLELCSNTLAQAIFFINIEYIGITVIPLAWFFFCLSFCNKECWYKKKLNMALMLIMPIATLIVVWTNSWHHLYYEHVELATNGPFPMLKLTPGIWYHTFTIYFYLLMACGCYLILNKFKTADPVFKKQNYSIVMAALLPWVANLAYLIGIRPLGIIDITPFALILATFFIWLAVNRFRLFDIIPIAREKVLELMNDGFVVLDEKYRIIDYNYSFYSYTTLPKNKKIIGCAIDEVFTSHDFFIESIKAGRSGKIELETLINDEIVYAEAEILFSNESKVNEPFTIVKLQDLTVAKKDSKVAIDQAGELEKLNQLKDRIFSIIAHDLRGPLISLSEVLKMVSTNEITDAEFKALTPGLSKDITYTTDLLENMLHWSRSQLEGFGIKKEFFNVRNIVINEINYHLTSATQKKIEIIHDIFPNEVAYADLLMFQIVIRNMLNNAIKFCSEGCEINISASYQKSTLLKIFIKDNGIGISGTAMAKLFNGESPSSRGTQNEKGTGLGLMICKDFMIRNGGNISVESAVGKGTTFHLTVPTTA